MHDKGDILNHEARTLEQRPVCGNVEGKQERFLDDPRKGAQAHVDGDNVLDSAPRGLFADAFNEITGDGEFMHGGTPRWSMAYPFAQYGGTECLCKLHQALGGNT